MIWKISQFCQISILGIIIISMDNGASAYSATFGYGFYSLEKSVLSLLLFDSLLNTLVSNSNIFWVLQGIYYTVLHTSDRLTGGLCSTFLDFLSRIIS